MSAIVKCDLFILLYIYIYIYIYIWYFTSTVVSCDIFSEMEEYRIYEELMWMIYDRDGEIERERE